MNRRKGLTDEEIIKLLNETDSSNGSDDSFADKEYVPSLSENDSCDEFEQNPGPSRVRKRKLSHVEYSSKSSTDSDSDDFLSDEVKDLKQVSNYKCMQKNKRLKKDDTDNVIWSEVSPNFEPRLLITKNRPTAILANINRSSNEFECFMSVFPNSLLIFISQCTNQRLEILRREKNVDIPDTDPSEIMMVLGIMLVMSYNRVPSFTDYWSSNSSLGNEAIKNAISRNRCLLLFSKMYFNEPEKNANAPKTYYMDEVVNCLKKTFLQAREESPFQSIDESMAKFKGRSSLKQYLPLKPIKRGIKIWERCDAFTGYTYDFNIYSGKNMDNTDCEGRTLGERVVLKLCSTIRNPDVTLTFDRFFTSVHLLENISFPSIGTCISSRKNMPQFSGRKLEKGDAEFLQNSKGILAAKWKDSKEVLIMSNCHGPDTTQVKRKQKNGERLMINCPTALADYNKFMGGVDLSDQKICQYDFDRRSTKWWKKVFYKLLMTAVVNAHILFLETKHKKIPLLQYIVPLAESLIAKGKENARIKRKKSGRPSNATKLMLNVGDHLPLEGPTRRRCARCAKQNKETRTKTVCTMCKVALCKNCFAMYHS